MKQKLSELFSEGNEQFSKINQSRLARKIKAKILFQSVKKAFILVFIGIIGAAIFAINISKLLQ